MFEQFPYADMQQLNLDWIIKIAKDFLDQYTHIQEIINQGLEDLDNKAEELTQLLDEWYNTHSEDIANQLAAALQELNDWFTQHEGYLDQILQDNIAAFAVAAEAKAAETIESIPADYTALSNDVNILKGSTAPVMGIDDTKEVVYNYSTKELNIPAGFILYKGNSYSRAAVTLNLTGYFANDACVLWIDSDRTIYPKAWNAAKNNTTDQFIGYVWTKYVYLNGIKNSNIKVINNAGVKIETSLNLMGSFIGIEADVASRKVVYDIGNQTILLPGGFKVYRGNTSAYSSETIAVVNSTAVKIWIKNDKTIYTTQWNSNSVQNLDDDCIGFIYGNTVQIAGIPDYCISVIESSIEKNGVVFGGSYIGINYNRQIVVDLVNNTITIPAGFNVYRGLGYTRSQDTTISIYNFTNGAGIIYLKRNGTIYAEPWSSRIINKPDDSVIGIFWGSVVWFNGVDSSRISVIKTTSPVFCFGDSITAGTGTTYAYHMYFHDWKPDAVLYNYGVGSTGYIYETSDTVTVGNGVVGLGSAHQETGNNSIIKVMQSVSAEMKNIIIAAGTNDFGTNQPINDFRTAVQNTLDYALTKSANILVLTPIKRNGWNTSRNSLGLLLKDYADVITEECDARGIVYADGFDVGMNPNNATCRTNFIPDGLHPNEFGHERMARSYWNKFMESVHIAKE